VEDLHRGLAEVLRVIPEDAFFPLLILVHEGPPRNRSDICTGGHKGAGAGR
jgi:hypothetical protein